MRAVRGDLAIDKRGDRSTEGGRRLEYFSTKEFFAHWAHYKEV